MWDRTTVKVEFTLIRHGETASNKEKRYLGRTEESLSKEGREQMLHCKEALKAPNVDILFVSPMKRCQESALLLFPDKLYSIIEEWKEMDFGRFEGKNYQDLKEDSYYQKWIDSQGTLPFPDGESQEKFVQRNLRGLKKAKQILESYLSCHPKEEAEVFRAAAVVHGGTIMALMQYLLKGEYFSYQAANACGYYLSGKLILLNGKIERLQINNVEEAGC